MVDGVARAAALFIQRREFQPAPVRSLISLMTSSGSLYGKLNRRGRHWRGERKQHYERQFCCDGFTRELIFTEAPP